MDTQDQLWKRIYQDMEKPTDSQIDVDQDGDFFKMFGNLTKPEEEDLQEPVEVEEETPTEELDDQPIEEEETDQLIKDFFGLNIEELYTEVLYEIIHMVGSEAETCDKEEIFQYLKDAFKLDDDRHQVLLQAAMEREAPNIILNVEIMEAKDLKPKDPNGLSDPFCTLFLSSAPTHKYHTCVKPETLCPVWEEHFSLPVDDTGSDVLCLQVWDFDPAETIKEKVTKISGVKGVKGLSKLMKEIAVTASTGKHDNEMIGVAQIQLKSIPSYGQTRWIELEKRPKSTVQGNLKLKLNFSSQKNHHVACQEYRHILRLLLLHELENNKSDAEELRGKLSHLGLTVLGQHSSQSGLSVYHENMAHWIEFTKLHSNHQLSFSLFANLIEPISNSIREGKYSQDELKLFWEGTKKLLPSIFSHIKHLKKISPKDRRNMDQTTSSLKILSYLCSLKISNEVDLFPKSLYGWLEEIEENEKSVPSIIQLAVRQATCEWFQQNLDVNEPETVTDENALKQAIKVTQIVRNDLQKAVEHFEKLFLVSVGISYSRLVYSEYEGKVCDLVEPLVNRICSTMKPIRLEQRMDDKDGPENDSINVGTCLFELYLLLQRLALLGPGIFSEEAKDLRINKFHNWFYHGVAKWLDIAVFKAMGRIDKAIELDKLTAVDETVKYSSSALDTLSTFYQIKIFWTQLAWPDVEGSYTFVAKILDDLCRCCIYYADNIGKKLNKKYESNPTATENSNFFSVTNEWCLAVNNIDYVKQSLLPFANDLGVESIIKKLADFQSQSTAQTCDHTIKLLMENAIDILTNKIIDLLETIAYKMAHPIKQMLYDVCNNSVDPEKDTDVLMQYLDNNLMILHSQLNVLNFQKILSIIWQRVIKSLNELITEGLETRKPAYFFKNLENTVDILKTFFQDGDKSLNTDDICSMKKLLYIYGLDTQDLIHEYYLERVEFQKSLTKSNHGMLTVKTYFVGDSLKIDVMNARNIPPHDSNGFCDPYVKIVLLPKVKFAHLGHLRTKTQKKTLFPLFEETFTIELKTEERLITNAVIHFIVKDQDFLYFNQFVGEAFIPLSDITTVTSSNDEVEQTHLILNKPQPESKIIKVLDMRQGEKQAKDFIKKQKNKMEGNKS